VQTVLACFVISVNQRTICGRRPSFVTCCPPHQYHQGTVQVFKRATLFLENAARERPKVLKPSRRSSSSPKMHSETDARVRYHPCRAAKTYGGRLSRLGRVSRSGEAYAQCSFSNSFLRIEMSWRCHDNPATETSGLQWIFLTFYREAVSETRGSQQGSSAKKIGTGTPFPLHPWIKSKAEL